MAIHQELFSVPTKTLGRRQVDRRWRYALSVLLGMDGRELPAFGECLYYGQEQDAPASARIVIKPSTFFREEVHNAASSLPQLPLSDVMGVPLLFGNPEVSRQGNRIVTEADLIASAYFLLTRHEEVIRRNERDEHGRFLGRASVPYRGGFLDRPIIDEYAQLLRRWLGQVGIDVPEPPLKIRKIYLTHDVDIPWRWPSLRSAFRGCVAGFPKQVMSPMLCYFGLKRDPEDCFDWIIEKDSSLVRRLGSDRVESIMFVLAGGASAYDGYYHVESGRVARLLRKLIDSGETVGLHASYEAGGDSELVSQEVSTLRKVVGKSITANRNHFLRCREPEDVRAFVEAGIKRDFTMAYADVAGFRLGTSRSVKWFDAEARKVTDLTLYPLTLMDVTLHRPGYMGLDYEGATKVSRRILDHVRRHNGDLVLLWHNTELADYKASNGSYQRKLYADLLGLLAS